MSISSYFFLLFLSLKYFKKSSPFYVLYIRIIWSTYYVGKCSCLFICFLLLVVLYKFIILNKTLSSIWWSVIFVMKLICLMLFLNFVYPLGLFKKSVFTSSFILLLLLFFIDLIINLLFWILLLFFITL